MAAVCVLKNGFSTVNCMTICAVFIMFLLLANDDGYLAPGIQALAEALRPEVERLVVMAPDRNMSGASHSLSLTRPLSVRSYGEDVYSVEGTPSDCVHLALTGYFDEMPDMVISGINQGANMGDDVMYSGTVAAAFAGRHLGLPAIAISNESHNPKHYDASAQVAVDLLKRIRQFPLPAGTLLNVNVPDLPYSDIRGLKTTVLGARHPSQPLVRTQNPRGQTFYWLGVAGQARASDENTDFYAVGEGFVSITPLQFDLTNHRQLQDVEHWLEG